MDITLKYLSAKDSTMAEHLAPKKELSKLKLPHHRGLLAVETKTAAPCGLMILSNVRDKRLDIEWLNVFETYRNEGIGSQLMEAAFQVAEQEKIPAVGVRMAGEYATPENIDAARSYFTDWGFDIGYFANGDWEISPAGYDASMGKHRKTNRNVFAAEEVDKDLIRRYLKQNWEKLSGSRLFDYNKVLQNYDGIFSMIYKTNNGIAGVLLCEFAGRVIYPLCLEDNGNPEIRMALLNGLRDAVADEEDRYKAHVISTEQSDRLIPDLFAERVTEPTVLWICSLEDYHAANASEDMEETRAMFGSILPSGVPQTFRWVGNDHYGDL